MGFFSRLFRRRKKEQEDQLLQAPQVQQEEIRQKKLATEKKEEEADVKEKKCPNCGAPNSDFAPVCWLCKKEMSKL